jgi:hypothetical protein
MGVASYRRQKAALEKRQAALAPQVTALAQAKAEAENAVLGKQEAAAARKGANEALAVQASELAQQETSSGMAAELAKLKGLVVLNEQVVVVVMVVVMVAYDGGEGGGLGGGDREGWCRVCGVVYLRLFCANWCGSGFRAQESSPPP